MLEEEGWQVETDAADAADWDSDDERREWCEATLPE